MLSTMVHFFCQVDNLDPVINKLVRSYMLNLEQYGIVMELFIGYNLTLDFESSKIFFAHNHVVRPTAVNEMSPAQWKSITLESQHNFMKGGVRIKGPFNVEWVYSNQPMDFHKNDNNFKMGEEKWELAENLKFYVILNPKQGDPKSDIFLEAFRMTYRKMYVGLGQIPYRRVRLENLLRPVTALNTSRNPIAQEPLKILTDTYI